MLLKFDETQANNYKSNSQKIRVMSEYWLEENAYCVKCGAKLNSFKNNKPVGDFYCDNCKEEFELKSKLGQLGNKISDGAYSTMIEKISNNEAPNFFFLSYTKSYDISNLIIIPKHYFTESIIEKRKPLAENARRAGWIGCNINLNPIPQSGKIYIINNNAPQNKDEVIEKYNKTIFLREFKNNSKKGWTLDVMKCVDLLNKKEFELEDIYNFEKALLQKHPENNNIKPKIRQQLQILRDKDYIEFLGKGKYKLK